MQTKCSRVFFGGAAAFGRCRSASGGTAQRLRAASAQACPIAARRNVLANGSKRVCGGVFGVDGLHSKEFG